MNRQWIKLYVEILDDPKMGRLPDRLWRRAVESFLMAGRNGGDEGRLPSVDEIAWAVRSTSEEVGEELAQLAQVGIVSQDEAGWFVTSFRKRQFSESYERVKRYRERYKGGTEGEEEALHPSSSPLLSSESDSEGGGGAGEEPRPMPTTPKQAKEHPDIQAYERVSGQFPGVRNYGVIVETIQFLRKQYGANLEEFLMPYWAAWSTRRTKDGRKYSPSSLVWLCEWAMQGEIPSANGHEPQIKGGKRSDVIRKVAQRG